MALSREAAIAQYRAELEKAPLGVYRSSDQSYTPIPASLDPLMISNQLWQTLQDDAYRILSALQKLGAHLRKDPTHPLFRKLSPLEQDQSDFWGLATARLDLFFDGADLRVIEANTTIPAMQAYSDMIKAAFVKTLRPDLKPLSSNTQDLLHSLLQHYERTGGRAARPRLAIVARDGDSQLAELLWLQKEWQASGYETWIVTPDQLEIKAEQLWTAAGPIDLVYRHIFAHRLPISSAFARACRQSQRYRIFNPIAAHLEAKSVLAELSSYAADEELSRGIGLDDDEIQATRERVVWSRLLQPGPAMAPDGSLLPDLVSWVKAHPMELVVKSSLGYGGHGIFIGSHFTEQSNQDRARLFMGAAHDVSWSQLLDFILLKDAGEWIVQEKVSGRKLKHRCLMQGKVIERESFVDCSIFTNSGVPFRPSGGASRFAGDAIVNIGQGGGLMPLLLESEIQ